MSEPQRTASVTADTRLWCVNIHGPDDVIAVADYPAAIRVASAFNEWWGEHIAKRPLTENDPLMWGEPMEWPYSAEIHADQLAHPSEEYAGFLSLSPAAGTETLRDARLATPPTGQSGVEALQALASLRHLSSLLIEGDFDMALPDVMDPAIAADVLERSLFAPPKQDYMIEREILRTTLLRTRLLLTVLEARWPTDADNKASLCSEIDVLIKRLSSPAVGSERAAPVAGTVDPTDWDAPEPITLAKVREWRAEADKLLMETMEGPYSVIVALCDFILSTPPASAVAQIVAWLRTFDGINASTGWVADAIEAGEWQGTPVPKETK